MVSTCDLNSIEEVTETKKTLLIFKVLRIIRLLSVAWWIFPHRVDGNLEFMADDQRLLFKYLVHIRFQSLVYVIFFGYLFYFVFQGQSCTLLQIGFDISRLFSQLIPT